MARMPPQMSAQSGNEIVAGFQLDDQGFIVTVRDGRHGVVRADPPQTALLLTGAPNAMAVAIYGPRPVAELAAAGMIAVTGDLAQAQRLVDLFSLGVR